MTTKLLIKNRGLLLLCGVFALSLGACAKKQVVKTPAPVEASDSALNDGINSEELDIHSKDFESSKNLKTIHFEFDRFALSNEARQILAENADYLKENADMEVLVEGHTDQRGTVGYNIALSQRRAQEVRKYYINLGIQSKRIGTLSLGKEKLSCVEETESCRLENRRAETKVRALKVTYNP